MINDVLSECGWVYLGGPWTWPALIVPVHTRCTGGPASEALGVEGHLTGRGRGGGGREDGGKGQLGDGYGGWGIEPDVRQILFISPHPPNPPKRPPLS